MKKIVTIVLMIAGLFSGNCNNKWSNLPDNVNINQTKVIPKIIFDTDIARVYSLGYDASDIDDLAALTILDALANKKLIEIICIVSNSRALG